MRMQVIPNGMIVDMSLSELDEFVYSYAKRMREERGWTDARWEKREDAIWLYFCDEGGEQVEVSFPVSSEVSCPIKPGLHKIGMGCAFPSGCNECGSKRVCKSGRRKNIGGEVQTYRCLDCGYRSTPRPRGYSLGLCEPDLVVVVAFDYHVFCGMSLTEVRECLMEEFGVCVNRSTILRWCRHEEIETFYWKLEPNLSEAKGMEREDQEVGL